MDEQKTDNVTSLSEEKCTALAELHGWSLAFAEGYVNGQIERRRGNQLSGYVMVGVDQYALGFRAGYFGRPNPDRGAGRSDSKPVVNTIRERDSTSIV